jgi:hypothetical protein
MRQPDMSPTGTMVRFESLSRTKSSFVKSVNIRFFAVLPMKSRSRALAITRTMCHGRRVRHGDVAPPGAIGNEYREQKSR